MKINKSIVSKAFVAVGILSLTLTACQNREVNLETDVSVPVSVQDIALSSIEEFTTTSGTISPRQEAEISSEMSGKYNLLINPKTGRKYSLGDVVQKDQVIIKLEDKEYENNIKIESVELTLETNKRNYEKIKSLYEKGGETLLALKNAESTYISSQYAYENAILQLAKLEIKAPFNGVLVDIPVYTEGTKVQSSSIMFKIMNYSKLYMPVNLPEKHLSKIKVGQPVRILNYLFPADTLLGKITELSPVINPDTRTFSGLLSIDNSDLKLRPGMYIKAEMIIDRRDSTIVIPKDIIMSKQRGKTVFVVDRGAAQERRIMTGLENPDEVEIIRGLNENDRLVIKGYETLRNRSKVKVVK